MSRVEFLRRPADAFQGTVRTRREFMGFRVWGVGLWLSARAEIFGRGYRALKTLNPQPRALQTHNPNP